MADQSQSKADAAAGRVSGVAERYATALFELAESQNALDDVERDLNDLGTMLNESEDLVRLVRSPVFSADEQLAAIGAVMDKAKLGTLASNFVRVVARNRRLFALPGMVRGFKQKMAAHRGEVSADVTVARALTDAQTKELKSTLKDVVGKDASLDVTVDPSLLGGMIVKIGSRQIDTSLRTKLSALKLALKEAG